MIFNSKEYFIDVVTFEDGKNQNINTFSNFDEVRYFITESIESGRISTDEKCRIMLSEKNFDAEAKTDAFWEGGDVDLKDLDRTMDIAALQLPFDLIENSSREYNPCRIDLNQYDCNCQLVLLYHYHGQDIRYSREFKNLIIMNQFIRENMAKIAPDKFDEGYNFAVEIREDNFINSAEQFVLAHTEFEPNTIRPLTTDEIMRLGFGSLLAQFDLDDIYNFEIEVQQNLYEL